MPVLYVENAPADLYEALRLRAKSEGRSISAEVMKLLAEHIPPPAVLARRRRMSEVARRIRKKQPATRKHLENMDMNLTASSEFI